MGIIKTKNETNLLKKSAQISNSCLKLIEYSLKENITEKELKRRVERKIRSQKASLAFRTLIACGKRSSMIHSKPFITDKIIKGIGYIDFGACYKGYKTDVTVPFVKGKISKKEIKIIKTTLKAYNLAISSIKLGQPCWKLFQIVNKYLKKNGFEMKHGLGHGIGLNIHEYPSITMPKKKLRGKKKRRWERIKKMVFMKGMIFTIEPGIYVKGLGGCRIENDILLTDNGLKILTHSKLIEI